MPRVTLGGRPGSEHMLDMSALGSPGIVLADSPDPVPDGEQLELRVLVSTDVDFTTAPDSYSVRLRLEFEPRY